MKTSWCALVAFTLGLWSCEPAARPSPAADAQQTAAIAQPVAPPSAATSTTHSEVGFRSSGQLDEHFAKHGADFGRISRDEYLRRAQLLRDAPVGGDILEIRRGDEVVSRFDRRSGAFIAFDADGTIRTFFRPNDGEAYFQRQARRRPQR